MIMKKRAFPGVSKSVAVLAVITAVLASPGFSDGKKTAPSGGEEMAGVKSAVVEARAKSMKWVDKAKVLFDAKDYAAALEALEKAVALDPENGWAHGRIGFIRIGMGELAAAKECFRRQYELGYEQPTALYNTSCAEALAGDPDKALGALATAVRHGWSDASLMAKDADLASIREDVRFQELLQRVQTAQELRDELAHLEKGGDPSLFLLLHGELASILAADGRLQSEHGHMALKAGHFQAAAKAFARQAEAGYDAPTAHYNRACAYSRGGDTAAAMEALRAAVELGMAYEGVAKDTDLDGLRDEAGFAELEARILAAAEARMDLKARLESGDVAVVPELLDIAADPDQPKKTRVWAAQAAGRLQLERARFEEAYTAFEEAAALGAEVQLSAFGMAQALSGAGKNDAALRHAAYALDLGYADPDALRALLEGLDAPAADIDAMVERAAKAKVEPKGEYGKKAKAWAAATKEKPKAYGAGKKVAQD